jgi:hypothetical protein
VVDGGTYIGRNPYDEFVIDSPNDVSVTAAVNGHTKFKLVPQANMTIVLTNFNASSDFLDLSAFPSDLTYEIRSNPLRFIFSNGQAIVLSSHEENDLPNTAVALPGFSSSSSSTSSNSASLFDRKKDYGLYVAIGTFIFLAVAFCICINFRMMALTIRKIHQKLMKKGGKEGNGKVLPIERSVSFQGKNGSLAINKDHHASAIAAGQRNRITHQRRGGRLTVVAPKKEEGTGDSSLSLHQLQTQPLQSALPFHSNHHHRHYRRHSQHHSQHHGRHRSSSHDKPIPLLPSMMIKEEEDDEEDDANEEGSWFTDLSSEEYEDEEDTNSNEGDNGSEEEEEDDYDDDDDDDDSPLHRQKHNHTLPAHINTPSNHLLSNHHQRLVRKEEAKRRRSSLTISRLFDENSDSEEERHDGDNVSEREEKYSNSPMDNRTSKGLMLQAKEEKDNVHHSLMTPFLSSSSSAHGLVSGTNTTRTRSSFALVNAIKRKQESPLSDEFFDEEEEDNVDLASSSKSSSSSNDEEENNDSDVGSDNSFNSFHFSRRGSVAVGLHPPRLSIPRISFQDEKEERERLQDSLQRRRRLSSLSFGSVSPPSSEAISRQQSRHRLDSDERIEIMFNGRAGRGRSRGNSSSFSSSSFALVGGSADAGRNSRVRLESDELERMFDGLPVSVPPLHHPPVPLSPGHRRFSIGRHHHASPRHSLHSSSSRSYHEEKVSSLSGEEEAIEKESTTLIDQHHHNHHSSLPQHLPQGHHSWKVSPHLSSHLHDRPLPVDPTKLTSLLHSPLVTSHHRDHLHHHVSPLPEPSQTIQEAEETSPNHLQQQPVLSYEEKEHGKKVDEDLHGNEEEKTFYNSDVAKTALLDPVHRPSSLPEQPSTKEEVTKTFTHEQQPVLQQDGQVVKEVKSDEIPSSSEDSKSELLNLMIRESSPLSHHHSIQEHIPWKITPTHPDHHSVPIVVDPSKLSPLLHSPLVTSHHRRHQSHQDDQPGDDDNKNDIIR